ncbi:unnamed protein product, partial [Rotaria magnacalcarata]
MSYNSNNYTKFEYPIGINKTDWIYAQDTLNLNYLKQIFNKLIHDNSLTLNNSDTNADLDNKRLNVNVKPFKAMLISTYSNLNDCFTLNNNTGIQFHKQQLATSNSFVHSIFNNEQSDTLLKRWHQLQQDKIQCQHNDVNQIKKEDIEYQLKELELQEEVQYKLLEKLLEKPFK